MYNSKIQAAALPLLALILTIFSPQASSAEPNAVLEASGEGLTYLNLELRSREGKELGRQQFKGIDGQVSEGITLPEEGGAEYEITAFDAEGRATYSGKGSIPSLLEGDRPLRLGLPSTDQEKGKGDGLVVSLSRERLVLEAFASDEPNNFTVDLQVLDPVGNPMKVDPNDIKWSLTDPTHFELVPLKERFQVQLRPKENFPKPVKLCDVPPVVVACLPNTFCRPIHVCPDPYVAVSAGSTHTCALTTSGAALCWGLNTQGQLGYPTTNSCNTGTTAGGGQCSTRPQRVDCPPGAPCRFTHISAGVTLTVAIDTHGDAWWWGRGSPNHNRVTATLAGKAVGFRMGAAGYGHGCAISSSDEVWCWGTNAFGESGLPKSNTEVPYWSPARILTPVKFKKIVAGGEHACGVDLSGYTVVCWGRDDENQTSGPSSTLLAVGTGKFYVQHFGGLTPINDVAASSNRTCVTLGSFNGVQCWGHIVGLNVMPFGMPEHLTSGWEHVCATSSQQASCVGSNNWGELGTGNIVHQPSPAPVKTPPSFYKDISAGDVHTCGLTPEGDIYCWGSNVWGQVGIGAVSYSVIGPAKVPTQ